MKGKTSYKHGKPGTTYKKPKAKAKARKPSPRTLGSGMAAGAGKALSPAARRARERKYGL